MALGTQSNQGQASRVFFTGNTYGGIPAATTAVDSEGVVLGRMQQETADRDRGLAAQGQRVQAAQADAQRAFEGGQNQANRDVQLQLGMAPINLKRDIFNQVSPLLTGLLGSNGQPGERVGGTPTPAPPIHQGPIWTDQQVEQQVNAGLAQNAANADQQTRANQTSTAAQGFGSQSPLLAALNSAVGMQRAANDASFARDTRFNTAKDNAQQQTATDTLAVNRWNLGEQNDIARRQMANNQVSQLAAVLAGLV